MRQHHDHSPQLGLRLRDRGIDAVSEGNDDWLRSVRFQARRLCVSSGQVTSDDLRALEPQLGAPTHPNAWGAIFKTKEFRCIGRVTSKRPSAHGREIKVWTLA